MTMTDYEAPAMNGHEPTDPTPAPDLRRVRQQVRDLIEHSELGPQLATEVREAWEDLQDQENQATGVNKRRLANRRHVLGLLLAGMETLHGIEGE